MLSISGLHTQTFLFQSRDMLESENARRCHKFFIALCFNDIHGDKIYQREPAWMGGNKRLGEIRVKCKLNVVLFHQAFRKYE